MPKVTGYIFESFDFKQAQAFNFFTQNDDEHFVRVEQGSTIRYVLVDCIEAGNMRKLCALVKEDPKLLVEIQADVVTEIGF